MLITANLSYKMPNISEKDKINVIKKIFLILQYFLSTVKQFSCTIVCTGAHREDHCSIIFSAHNSFLKAVYLFFINYSVKLLTIYKTCNLQYFKTCNHYTVNARFLNKRFLNYLPYF